MIRISKSKHITVSDEFTKTSLSMTYLFKNITVSGALSFVDFKFYMTLIINNIIIIIII
jgi:hypothetical protein